MALPLNKPVSLLVYLAFRADWVSRDELLLLYYPDIDEKTARHRLRQLAYRAKNYPWANTLELNDDSLRWLPKTDLQRFQEALNKGRYQDAIEQYQGEFVKGLKTEESPGFEAWLELKRSEFAEQYLSAVLGLSKELFQASAYVQASFLVKQALAISPFSEALVQTLMRSYYLAGETQSALHCFKGFSDLLQEEMLLEPSPETLELAERMQRGEPLEAQVQGLPHYATPFLGRETELSQIADLLSDENCRLMTLVGIGGMGKTRLCAEAARRQAGHFKDGVFFVALASLTSANAAIAAIADALGLKLYEPLNPAKQLLDFLRNKELLLVLDNLEQLRDLGVWLKQGLDSSSAVKWLLSSREPLHLRAEHILKVNGLTLPSAEANSLTSVASAQLFIQTAKRLKHELDVQTEQQNIVEICQLVGGMPLALELSASWINLLSPAEIKAEIEHDLGFLKGDWQDLAGRHQNIAQLLESSWRRLDKDTQTTLMALSLFGSSFRQEEARALSQGSLNALRLLEQRSLLQRQTETSFELHPLLRQFVAQKLAQESALRFTLKARMSDIYAGLLTPHQELIYTRQQEESLGFIERHLADAVAALRYAAETLSCSSLRRLADVLYAFYLNKANWEAGFQIFDDALKPLDAQKLKPEQQNLLVHLRCYWLFFAQRLAKEELVNSQLESLSNYVKTVPESADNLICLLIKIDMSYKQADYQMAKASYLDLLESHSRHQDHQRVVWLGNLGNICSRLGQWQEAQQYYETALDLAFELQIPRLLAKTLTRLGDINADFGHYDKALAYYQEGLGIFETLDAQFDTSIAYNNLATVHHVLKNYEQAVYYYQRGLGISQRLGDSEGVALSYMNLAEIAFDQQQYQEAIKEYENALGIYKEVNDSWHSVKAHALLASAYLTNQQTRLAQQSLKKALEDALELSSDTLVLEVLFHAAVFFHKTQALDPSPCFALIWQHPASYEDQRVLIRNYLKEEFPKFEALEPPELKKHARDSLARMNQS